MNSFEEIWKNPQKHTFFTMLGHFDFDKLSNETEVKTQWISSAVDFLLREGIDLGQLKISYHPNNSEIIEYWQEKWIDSKNIHPVNNWHTADFLENYQWFRTKIWIQKWEKIFTFWDLVFIKNIHINHIIMDSWMALERLYMIKEWKNNSFETTYWSEFINQLEKTLHPIEKEKLFRIADLLKASIYLLNENIPLSHSSHGFVMKKIIKELYILLSKYKQKEVESLIESTIKFFQLNNEIIENFLQNYYNIWKSLQQAERKIIKDIMQNNFKSYEFYQNTYGIHYEMYDKILNMYKAK